MVLGANTRHIMMLGDEAWIVANCRRSRPWARRSLSSGACDGQPAYWCRALGPHPRVFLVVATVLALVGLFACWLPARRAAALDPVKAIRYE